MRFFQNYNLLLKNSPFLGGVRTYFYNLANAITSQWKIEWLKHEVMKGSNSNLTMKKVWVF